MGPLYLGSMPRVSREGEVLSGKYRLEKMLGKGAVGLVYRAQNTLIGRTVAIKLLRPEHASDDELVARFLREARAANLVRHPNVVDVLDIGQDEDGVPFIVEEFLEGQDLAKYVQRQGGRLSVQTTLQLMVPVCEAVGLAHSKGVVHRDLKPENVFLSEVGPNTVPKLLDFGLSRVQLLPEDVRMTATGMTMGSPAYMSPEQIEGSKELDARADVWSLGVILFEVLTGNLPFRGESHVAVFVQIAWAEPPRIENVLPNVPADLATVVSRCLRREREQRYPNASELAVDLRRVRDGVELAVRRKTPMPGLAAVRIESRTAPFTERDPAAGQLADVRPLPAPPHIAKSLQPSAVESIAPRHAPDVAMTGATVDLPDPQPELKSSGIDLKSVPPPPTPGAAKRTRRGASSDELEASAVWDGAGLVFVALGAAGLLTIVLHRPGGWPMASWGRAALDGSVPLMSGLVGLLACAGGVSFGMQAVRSEPRSWGLAASALGLIVVGAPPVLVAVSMVLGLGHLGAVGGAVGWGLALVPTGVGLSVMHKAWQQWRGGNAAARVRGALLGSLAAILLFAAVELVRGALGS
jgi:eukaryotic-like serine/threonine-protein kinase